MNAFKSEVRKIFTTKLWWGLLIGAVIVSGGIAALFAAQIGTDAVRDGELAVVSPQAAQSVYSGGFQVTLLQLFPLALGVLIVTAEFRHKTWTSTVLSTPKRWQISVAKIAAAAVVGIVYGLVCDVAAVVGGGLVMSLAKNGSFYLGSGDVWQTLALMVLVFVIWVLLGMGFGLLLRNQIAAVFVAIGLAFVGDIMFNIIFRLLKWDSATALLPSSLTSSTLNPHLASVPDQHYFTWWVSALILTAYGLGLAVVGSIINQRKDVL